jgi:hypothetical protein
MHWIPTADSELLPNSSASAQITCLLELGCIGGLLARVLGVTPECILSLTPEEALTDFPATVGAFSF